MISKISPFKITPNTLGATNMTPTAHKTIQIQRDVFTKSAQISMTGQAKIRRDNNPFEQDIPAIKDIIGQYKYGKADLVDNPSDFRVEVTPTNVILHNYRDLSPEAKSGTCEELAYKAGVEIQEKFGDKYTVMAVRAHDKHDNMGHYYLALYENNEENAGRLTEFKNTAQKTEELSAAVKRLTEVEMPKASGELYEVFHKIAPYPQARALTMQLIGIMQQGKTLQKRDIDIAMEIYSQSKTLKALGESFLEKVGAVQNIQKQANEIFAELGNSARVTPHDFEGALMVDPSFGEVRMFSKGILHKEYPQDELKTLDSLGSQMDEYIIPVALIQPNQRGERIQSMAFGFMEDLAPELSDKLGADTFINLRVKLLDRDRARLSFTYTPKYEKQPKDLNVESLLGEEHKLTKFLEVANK